MTTNIVALPLLLLIWGIDSLLFLIMLRVVLRRFAPTARMSRSLQDLTDPIFHLASDGISNRFARRMRDWEVHAIVIAGLVAGRFILLAVLLAVT